MSDKIALAGVLLSGKTSFARYLRDNHGYYLVSFTDKLKEEYAKSHAPLTVEDILKNKDQFRQELQDFSNAIGYHTGGKVGYWVDRSLQGWRVSGVPRVVFDNVRTVDQAEYLSSLGFLLVRLSMSDETLRRNACAEGRDVESMYRSMDYSPELERAEFPVDITLYEEPWNKAALIVMRKRVRI